MIGVIKIEKLCFVNLNNSKERRNDVNINNNIALREIRNNALIGNCTHGAQDEKIYSVTHRKTNANINNDDTIQHG